MGKRAIDNNASAAKHRKLDIHCSGLVVGEESTEAVRETKHAGRTAVKTWELCLMFDTEWKDQHAVLDKTQQAEFASLSDLDVAEKNLNRNIDSKAQQEIFIQVVLSL